MQTEQNGQQVHGKRLLTWLSKTSVFWLYFTLSAARTNPVAASVVLFLLFFDTFIPHLHQLFEFFFEFIAVAFVTVIYIFVEPLPEHLREIFRSLDAFEVLCEY